MGATRVGVARVPARDTPETAIAALQEGGFTASELDFEGGFWMDYAYAERFGELAREADIALSVHAPIAAFVGHVERGKKLNMAIGMLDHSAGIAVACGAELVVFHPGFLLGRERAAALEAVVEQLGELRARLEKKERAVPFGIEIMGRVRELGSLDDVVEVARRTGWVRPVVDFAHLHASATAPSSTRSASPRCWRRPTPCSPSAPRSTCTSRTSATRIATRIVICPTARGRSAPSPYVRRSTASTGPRP